MLRSVWRLLVVAFFGCSLSRMEDTNLLLFDAKHSVLSAHKTIMVRTFPAENLLFGLGDPFEVKLLSCVPFVEVHEDADRHAFL